MLPSAPSGHDPGLWLGCPGRLGTGVAGDESADLGMSSELERVGGETGTSQASPRPCHSWSQECGPLQLLLGHLGSRCYLVLLPNDSPRPRGRACEGWGTAPTQPLPAMGALFFVSCSLTHTPQMSGVARLFPYPSSSSLHGRFQPGLAPSPLGGRRALPRLWTTGPCLVNGRPGPSAAGAAP